MADDFLLDAFAMARGLDDLDRLARTVGGGFEANERSNYRGIFENVKKIMLVRHYDGVLRNCEMESACLQGFLRGCP